MRLLGRRAQAFAWTPFAPDLGDKEMTNCDPLTGLCERPEPQGLHPPPSRHAVAKPTVRYIGDPMCSWCWGIAPALQELAKYCAGHTLDFKVTVGGLRSAGTELWTGAFRSFLRHEWEKVHQATGQPFGFSLLDNAEFDYDTEPACRAVVTIARLLEGREGRDLLVLTFFSDIQRRFYVAGEDPKQLEFYRDLCAATGVSYDSFREQFLSAEAARSTAQEIEQCRRWGVHGFPSILLDHEGGISRLASGYASATELIARLETRLARQVGAVIGCT